MARKLQLTPGLLVLIIVVSQQNRASAAPPVRVRLAGGARASEGRVELFHEGAWGTVCDDDWDMKDGNVVCRSLGHQFAVRVTDYSSFGRGSGPIHLDNVKCEGSEKSLAACQHKGWGEHNCLIWHSEDAGVVCYEQTAPPIKWRLVGGSEPNGGRVEVYFNGTWGAVCDSFWDMREANIVCNSLGYQGAKKELVDFGRIEGPVYLNWLICDGSEKSLADCLHDGWGELRCDGRHVGVICNEKPAPTGSQTTVVTPVDEMSTAKTTERMDTRETTTEMRTTRTTETETTMSATDTTTLSPPTDMNTQSSQSPTSKAKEGTTVTEAEVTTLGMQETSTAELGSMTTATTRTTTVFPRTTMKRDSTVTMGTNAMIRTGASTQEPTRMGTTQIDSPKSTIKRDGTVTMGTNTMMRTGASTQEPTRMGTPQTDSPKSTIKRDGTVTIGTNTIMRTRTSTQEPTTLGTTQMESSRTTMKQDRIVTLGTNTMMRTGTSTQEPATMGTTQTESSRSTTGMDGEGDTTTEMGMTTTMAATVGAMTMTEPATSTAEHERMSTSSTKSETLETESPKTNASGRTTTFVTSTVQGAATTEMGKLGTSTTLPPRMTTTDSGDTMTARTASPTGQMTAGTETKTTSAETRTTSAETKTTSAETRTTSAEIMSITATVVKMTPVVKTTVKPLDTTTQTPPRITDTDVKITVVTATAVTTETSTATPSPSVKMKATSTERAGNTSGMEMSTASGMTKTTMQGLSTAPPTEKTSTVVAEITESPDERETEIVGKQEGIATTRATVITTATTTKRATKPTTKRTTRAPLTPVRSNFIRLVGGDTPNQGRVEVFYNNSWGTVCDDMFDMRDANVVCKSLGFPHALEHKGKAYFGEGTGRIWMDNMKCSGEEASLAECEFNGWGKGNCYHQEDVGVICNDGTVDTIRARLANGDRETSGRVELYYSGSWGTICDDYWSLNNAHVICRMMGFPRARWYYTGGYYGRGAGPILLDNVQCRGDEESIVDCDHRGWGVSRGCSHYEDAGVVCEERPKTTTAPTTTRTPTTTKAPTTTPIPSTTTTSPTTHATSHSTLRLRNTAPNTVARVTKAKSRLRLVGGKRPNEGRVEVFYNGAWGTVCDDRWDIDDAHVVCRSLGYSFALQAKEKAFFGPGRGHIHMDDVRCSGGESSLVSCQHNGWGVANCGHQEDAGVVCNDGSVPAHYTRLVGGKNNKEGRVEVYHDGEWGTVCDDRWGINVANVVCRSLGFDFALRFKGKAAFGEGKGPILLDNVRCEGSESSVVQCKSRGWAVNNCQHKEDAGVVCSDTPFRVRLAGGNRPNEGRVEVSPMTGIWGTVCSDSWDMLDANVVCRSLGYRGAAQYKSGGFFGRGPGPIYLDDVRCKGTEKSLTECEHPGFGVITGCTHSDDAGVVCFDGSGTMPPTTPVEMGVPPHRTRLVGGRGPQEGRVEVYYKGEWGTVCDDDFDLLEAKVICKSLGFPAAKRFTRYASFGQGSGPILLDNVACKGTEKSLVECPSRGWGVENCRHAEDAGVECWPKGYRTTTAQPPTTTPRPTTATTTPLPTTTKATPTTTKAPKTTEAATTEIPTTRLLTTLIRRTTKYPSKTEATTSFTRKRNADTSTTITSSSLEQRTTARPTTADVVTPQMKVRLVEGTKPSEGRVEVYYSGQWGTVCDKSWDILDAHVVCRSLGYPKARKYKKYAFFGHGTGPVWLDNVKCTGRESSLERCPHLAGETFCGHHRDAGVMCYEREPTTSTVPSTTPPTTPPTTRVRPSNIRLVGGTRPSEGRVEVLYRGAWGTICDDFWDVNDAHVVCRSLGYRRALRYTDRAFFGEGRGKIWLDGVSCTGSERSLFKCRHQGWGIQNCQHDEDAGVVCENETPFTPKIPNHRTRLIGGSRRSEGRVEVYYEGAWGTVCDDLWDRTDADVVCKSLGYSGSRSATSRGSFGQGTGRILLDNVECRGDEKSVLECQHQGIGVNNCQHKEDAGVICVDGSPATEPYTDEPSLTNGYQQTQAPSASSSPALPIDVLPHRTRLMGGIRPSQGRVEVFYNGKWGTVCNDFWTDVNANVVCRSLGYGESYGLGYNFGPGSGPIHMDNIVCAGDEASLVDCLHNGWGEQDCTHEEDVSVVCSEATPSTASKLPTKPPAATRRTQQSSAPQPTTAQTTNKVTSKKSTREMDKTTLQTTRLRSTVGTVEPSIKRQEPTTSTTRKQDPTTATPKATPTPSLPGIPAHRTRLVGGRAPSEGRVEVYYDGVWGTVCDDLWSLADANVVCKSLGYKRGAKGYTSRAYFGPGKGPIWLDAVLCDGSEKTLLECSHRGWGMHYCDKDHTEDAGVVCYST